MIPPTLKARRTAKGWAVCVGTDCGKRFGRWRRATSMMEEHVELSPGWFKGPDGIYVQSPEAAAVERDGRPSPSRPGFPLFMRMYQLLPLTVVCPRCHRPQVLEPLGASC